MTAYNRSKTLKFNNKTNKPKHQKKFNKSFHLKSHEMLRKRNQVCRALSKSAKLGALLNYVLY